MIEAKPMSFNKPRSWQRCVSLDPYATRSNTLVCDCSSDVVHFSLLKHVKNQCFFCFWMLNPHVKAMFLDVSGPNKDAKSGGADEPKRPG